jgi:Icc protein
MTVETTPRPLAFAHIGDLHITNAKQRNYLDFLAIVAQIEAECAGSIDFVVLPGDNADNGKPDQYRLIATALKMLSAPVHLIAGDHDMEQGGLEAFYTGLPAERLPKTISVHGVRCMFLDINGPGCGGPDFRLGEDQIKWLELELCAAGERRETVALFARLPRQSERRRRDCRAQPIDRRPQCRARRHGPYSLQRTRQ